MESLKKDFVNFGKGVGIWFLLMILNTRSGEGDANSIKIILDIVLAVILVGNSRIGKYVAILVTVLTTLVTFLPIPSGLEVILLIGIVILGGVLLKNIPKVDPLNGERQNSKGSRGTYTYGSSENTQWNQKDKNFFDSFRFAHRRNAEENFGGVWHSKNFLRTYEKYSFSPEMGISIHKGFFQKSYITIPTNNAVLRIYQDSIWQSLVGICNVSILSAFTGQLYGGYELQNIPLKSARELQNILNRNATYT